MQVESGSGRGWLGALAALLFGLSALPAAAVPVDVFFEGPSIPGDLSTNFGLSETQALAANAGFAVPIDTINRVVPRLITYGQYVRPTIGITANDELSRRLLRGSDETGVVVLQVVAGSPADRAGLRAAEMTGAGRVQLGDVIVGLDGKPIEDFGDLDAELDAHQFGDSVTLTVRRNGQRREVDVTLGAADVPGTL